MNAVTLARIRAATSRNDHTEARIILADWLGDTQSAKSLRAILEVQDTIGYIAQSHIEWRQRITDDLLAQIATLHSQYLAAIRAAL